MIFISFCRIWIADNIKFHLNSTQSQVYSTITCMSTNKLNNILRFNISHLMRHENYSSVQNAPTVIGFGSLYNFINYRQIRLFMWNRKQRLNIFSTIWQLEEMLHQQLIIKLSMRLSLNYNKSSSMLLGFADYSQVKLCRYFF